ncbi:MAG: hypothetical protein ACP5NF_11170 [Thermoanaerobaculum sp.]
MNLLRVSFVGLGVLMGSAFTCDIRVGGGPSTQTYVLGVPYRAQECTLCCGAATIQMLQAYCQWPEMPQVQILQAIGGSPATGASWDQIANGMNALTCYEGAVVKYYYRDDPNQLALAVTEQIASVVWGGVHLPVLPQVSFNHVGVLFGGTAHDCGFAQYCWDSVAVHDPARGTFLDLSATEWLGSSWFGQSQTLIQIVPATVSNAGPLLLSEYRSNVRIWDGEGFEPPFENL